MLKNQQNLQQQSLKGCTLHNQYPGYAKNLKPIIFLFLHENSTIWDLIGIQTER